METRVRDRSRSGIAFLLSRASRAGRSNGSQSSLAALRLSDLRARGSSEASCLRIRLRPPSESRIRLAVRSDLRTRGEESSSRICRRIFWPSSKTGSIEIARDRTVSSGSLRQVRIAASNALPASSDNRDASATKNLPSTPESSMRIRERRRFTSPILRQRQEASALSGAQSDGITFDQRGAFSMSHF